MIMKIIREICIACLCIYAISSCQKDLGNYNYSELNEVAIAALDSNYSLLRGDRLTISPQLSYTQNADTNLFTYEWRYNGPTGDQGRTDSVIHTGIALNQIIDWDPGNYHMYYRITEKSTGIIYTKFFTVAVGELGYEGWLLLSDIGGQSRLDMLNFIDGETFIPQIDLLAAMHSNVLLEGSPVSVNRGFNPFGHQLYVVTSKEGYHLRPASYQTDVPGVIHLPLSALIPSSASLGFADARINMNIFTDYIYTNGGLYYRNYDVHNTVNHTVGPINTNAENQRYTMSPFFATTGNVFNPQAILFNTEEKMMYRFLGLPGIISDPLTINGLDMQYYDLVFMDYSTYNGGYVFAVFKDTRTRLYQLAQFNMNGRLAFLGQIDGPEIDEAKLFTIHPDWGYLLYAANGKIYEYDLGTRRTSLMQSYAGREISYLAFPKMLTPLFPSFFTSPNRNTQYGRRLIVCTYDENNPATSGDIRFYTVPTLNRPFVSLQSYEGFGKIVSVVYNEK